MYEALGLYGDCKSVEEMRVIVNRCDEFGRISSQTLEVGPEMLIAQVKAQLSILFKVPENLIILKPASAADSPELLNTQSICDTQLQEGAAISMEQAQFPEEPASPSHPHDPEEEETKEQPIKSKSQWLALLLQVSPTQLCKAGDHNTILRLLSDYDKEVSASMIEVDEDELISKPGPAGWTPLHYACHKGFIRIVQTLCSRKACPNVESEDHWTPLQLAAYHGHNDCKRHSGVRILLKHEDIHVNRMTATRPPPLHIAVSKGFDEIVERLLQKDASTTLEGPDGKYPLEIAEKPSIMEMLPKYQGDKMLKQYSLTSQDCVSDFHGKVVLTGALLLNDKEVFLSLNLTRGDLAYYESQEEFLAQREPITSLKLVNIYGVKECNAGLFSDKGLFFFIVAARPRPLKIYTVHDGLTSEWIKRIRQGINLALERRLGMEYLPEKPDSRPVTPQDNEKAVPRHSNTGISIGLAEDDAASPTAEHGGSHEAVNFSSFTVLEELGSGSFGKVYKCFKNDSKRVFAVKCLSKQFLIKQKQLQYAISECKILRGLNHPFILHMHYAFQTPKNLYMVLDFCPNGDLLAHLQERMKFGESVGRFYCAEILMALEYLHSLDIVYRDLKPENILVDRAGHILMADFGLAKENVNSMNPAMSFCGSPAYLAPELLNKQGSEKSADVYSYGAILYEMLTGLPPFYSENIKELFKNIKNAQLQFPASVRPEAKDLIKKVMNRDAAKRPTISQLKRHPFFREIDWDAMLAKKVRPPRLGPSWVQVDEEVEGMINIDYNAASGLVIDEDYKEGDEEEELVDEFNY